MICSHCGSEVEFDKGRGGWLCSGCKRVFTKKKKKRSPTAPPFSLHQAYVESLENEIKELKRDIVDMARRHIFSRCLSCGRMYDSFQFLFLDHGICPHCGNRRYYARIRDNKKNQQ